jgi:PIN domain nuclease of toxin-antitoxin system
MLNLLDTHTFIWFINGDTHLSTNAIKRIQSDGAINFISIASIWEIAVKISLGKLELRKPFAEIESQIQENGFQVLPMIIQDMLIVSSLPFHHRYPFDRLIIAQSLYHKLSIITKDDIFRKYSADVFW